MRKYPDKAKVKLICLDCGKKFEETIGVDKPESHCPDCDSEYVDLCDK